jgi:hypothetical protein
MTIGPHVRAALAAVGIINCRASGAPAAMAIVPRTIAFLMFIVAAPLSDMGGELKLPCGHDLY